MKGHLSAIVQHYYITILQVMRELIQNQSIVCHVSHQTKSSHERSRQSHERSVVVTGATINRNVAGNP